MPTFSAPAGTAVEATSSRLVFASAEIVPAANNTKAILAPCNPEKEIMALSTFNRRVILRRLAMNA
jgi:hypothetical protein